MSDPFTVTFSRDGLEFIIYDQWLSGQNAMKLANAAARDAGQTEPHNLLQLFPAFDRDAFAVASALRASEVAAIAERRLRIHRWMAGGERDAWPTADVEREHLALSAMKMTQNLRIRWRFEWSDKILTPYYELVRPRSARTV